MFDIWGNVLDCPKCGMPIVSTDGVCYRCKRKKENTFWIEKKQVGWECPVCKKGNAPWALKCGHCKDKEQSRNGE